MYFGTILLVYALTEKTYLSCRVHTAANEKNTWDYENIKFDKDNNYQSSFTIYHIDLFCY